LVKLFKKYESIEEWIEEGKRLGNFGIFLLIFGISIFIVFRKSLSLIIAIVGLAIKIGTEYRIRQVKKRGRL
jgi:hypothetical protein